MKKHEEKKKNCNPFELAPYIYIVVLNLLEPLKLIFIESKLLRTSAGLVFIQHL